MQIITSGSVFQQQPRWLRIGWFYKEFWEEAARTSKIQCQLSKYTLAAPPLSPGTPKKQSGQLLEARWWFIFRLSGCAKGAEALGKRTRWTSISWCQISLRQQEYYWFECQVSKVLADRAWLQISVGLLTGRSGTLASFQLESSISTGREASIQGLPRPLYGWGGQLPPGQITVTASRAQVRRQNKPQGSGHMIKGN